MLHNSSISDHGSFINGRFRKNLQEDIILDEVTYYRRLPFPFRKEEFIKTLEDLGIILPADVSETPNLLTSCPLCRRENAFYVDFSKLVWHCSAGCGEGGIVELRWLLEQVCEREHPPKPLEPPPDIVPRGPGWDPKRAEAAEKGLEMLLEAAQGPSDWVVLEPGMARVLTFLGNVREGWRRCGRAVYYRRFTHKLHGDSYQPEPAPCHEPGHERCSWHHAKYDLQKWQANFDYYYGSEPLAVLKCDAPGYGPRALRDVVGRFKARRPLRQLLRGTVGVLVPTTTGGAYLVLVRKKDLVLLPRAEQIWKQIIPDGSLQLLTVDPSARPLEVAAELRCQAEQAIFLLVASGELDPQAGLNWLCEALGLGRRPTINRIVFGVGFQKVPPSASSIKRGEAVTNIADSTQLSSSQASSALATFSSRGTVDDNRTSTLTPTQLGLSSWELHQLNNLVTLLRKRGLNFDQWITRHIDELEWEDCKICGRPECGQRPTNYLIHFTKINSLVQRQELMALEQYGEVVAYIHPRDQKWASDG